MDYSYRNNRYKRKRTRRFRRFIAMIVVSLTAGVLVAGYGLIHLFSENKGDKKVENSTEISSTTTMDNSLKPDESSVVRVIDEEETVNETVETAETEENKKKGVLASRSQKIEDLVKFSSKEASKYFEDTAFIGDSRTQGLQINAGIKSAKFFAGRGLNVKNALTDKVVRGKNNKNVTVVDALDGKEYKKVYISFGINELGWTNLDIFIERYQALIKAVEEKQPKAEIVVYGILPVTKKKSDKDKVFNMKNVKKFNKRIKKMAEEMEITYVDLSDAVKNEKGFLPDEVTPDGIHMNKDYCRRILAYIVNKKI